MGTRADFYVGRGESAEWLGSIAMDGYPDGLSDTPLLGATTEAGWRAMVRDHIAHRRDGTLPEEGWPWPWENSHTTDYSYAFDGDRVWATCFGYSWWDAREPEPEISDDAVKTTVFPTMKTDRAAFSGPRSGLIVVTSRGVL